MSMFCLSWILPGEILFCFVLFYLFFNVAWYLFEWDTVILNLLNFPLVSSSPYIGKAAHPATPVHSVCRFLPHPIVGLMTTTFFFCPPHRTKVVGIVVLNLLPKRKWYKPKAVLRTMLPPSPKFILTDYCVTVFLCFYLWPKCLFWETIIKLH